MVFLKAVAIFLKKIRFSITDVPYVKFLFKNFWSGPLQKPFR